MLLSFDTLACAVLGMAVFRCVRKAIIWDLNRAERLREERDNLLRF